MHTCEHWQAIVRACGIAGGYEGAGHLDALAALDTTNTLVYVHCYAPHDLDRVLLHRRHTRASQRVVPRASEARGCWDDGGGVLEEGRQKDLEGSH